MLQLWLPVFLAACEVQGILGEVECECFTCGQTKASVNDHCDPPNNMCGPKAGESGCYGRTPSGTGVSCKCEGKTSGKIQKQAITLPEIKLPMLAGLRGALEKVQAANDKKKVAAAVDEEPLLKPLEPGLVWQISGMATEHKVPLQLVLTSKLAEARGLPNGVRSNIIHTLSMDPQMRLRWLDDSACLEYLETHFTKGYADMLRRERRGSFRGDICRAAVLYREGGFYTDLDVELRIPLTQVVDKKTTFMSCFTADNAILNALVAAAPRSTVMRETLRELRKWYNGDAPQAAASDGADGTTSEWMGPLTMLRGVKAAMRKECKDKAIDSGQLRIPCGSGQLQLYREAELICDGVTPTEECPAGRMNSEFIGTRFGMFDLSGSDRRLIGWPRFEGCMDWGCQSGGWDESDMPTNNIIT